MPAVEKTCFKGVDAAGDFLAFYSVPILLHRFTIVAEATINSRTGKRFFNMGQTGSFTSGDRTVNPDTREPIGAKDAASGKEPNPVYEFEFADAAEDFLIPEGAQKCGECFNCKVCIYPFAHTHT